MLNAEKYKSEIMKIICDGEGCLPAVKKNKPDSCKNVICSTECLLYGANCNIGFMMWALSEYVPPVVDWTNVPVDARILVRDKEIDDWVPAHFAKYLEESDTIVAWVDGRTSHTTPDIKTWRFAILAEDL